MREFVYLGSVHLREYARQVEQVNRHAWMLGDGSPETPPRRRFPRLRGT